jgi:Immunoglobulin V-set domain
MFHRVFPTACITVVRIATAGQIQPANTAVVVGTSVRLTCSAGQSITFAQWTFYPTGTASAVIVYQGVSCIRSSTGYPLVGYSVDATNSTNGQCDLIIYTATASQAGWYTCALTSAPPVNNVAAQVTVFG